MRKDCVTIMATSAKNEEFLASALPFWKAIKNEQREQLLNEVKEKNYRVGDFIHKGNADCDGLFLIKEGQCRVYMLSSSGKEVTLYRLLEGDLTLFSASCMLNGITFDVYIEAEKETKTLLIPTCTYSSLSKTSLDVANYTNDLLSSRFSDVMWVMEQIMFMSMDKRIALFLLEQLSLEDDSTIKMTHDVIAKNVGTAREVVSRMLKYFQSEGIVSLCRGGVRVLDEKKLQKICED